MKKIIILLVCLFFLGLLSVNAGRMTGTTRYGFLKIGVGARAIAIGESYVAVADDLNGIYWNPAGLAGMKLKEFIFMHNIWMEDTSQEYFAFGFPAAKGAFGASINYLNSGEMMIRDENNIPSGSYSFSDMAITFSYGINILDKDSQNISAGLGLKNIMEWAGIEPEDFDMAFAFDLGLLARFGDFSAGLGVQNFGGEGLPMNINAGTALRLTGDKLLLTAGIKLPVDNGLGINAGVEYQLSRAFALRIGYKYGEENPAQGVLAGLSGGFGFRFEDPDKTISMLLDMAAASYGGLGGTYRVSIGIRFLEP